MNLCWIFWIVLVRKIKFGKNQTISFEMFWIKRYDFLKQNYLCLEIYFNFVFKRLEKLKNRMKYFILDQTKCFACGETIFFLLLWYTEKCKKDVHLGQPEAIFCFIFWYDQQWKSQLFTHFCLGAYVPLISCKGFWKFYRQSHGWVSKEKYNSSSLNILPSLFSFQTSEKWDLSSGKNEGCCVTRALCFFALTVMGDAFTALMGTAFFF